MTAMKVGEVAKLSGPGIETSRFYEREGLLPKPERRPSGYRRYGEATIGRLDYIRRAK
jgi:MerR family copper efflux transcriptional regulator